MKYCRECGAEIMEKAVVCPKCGCATGYKEHKNFDIDLGISKDEKYGNIYSKKIVLLLWLIGGCIGLHRFYVGDILGGLIILTCLIFNWLIIPLFILIGFIIYDFVDILSSNELAHRKLKW